MIQLENAKMSPRIENGTLCWYRGDEFSFSINLVLTDTDGEIVEILPEDKITVLFEDEKGEEVKKFEFTSVSANTITLEFMDEVTALFKKRKYKYDITIDHNGITTTLAKGNDVLVE